MEDFHQPCWFKGLRWLLWTLQHKRIIFSLLLLEPRLLSGPADTGAACNRRSSGGRLAQKVCMQSCRTCFLVHVCIWEAQPDLTFGFLRFYLSLLCVCGRPNQSCLWSQPSLSPVAGPVAVNRHSTALYLQVGWGDHPCSEAPHKRGHL